MKFLNTTRRGIQQLATFLNFVPSTGAAWPWVPVPVRPKIMFTIKREVAHAVTRNVSFSLTLETDVDTRTAAARTLRFDPGSTISSPKYIAT